MKKSILTTLVAVMLVVAVIGLMGCKQKEGPDENSFQYGETKPTVAGKALTGSDTDMFLQAVENYYSAPYVGQVGDGGVNTVILGGISIYQAVQCEKFRDGDNYFLLNKSFGAASLWEEVYINNGTMKTRTSKSAKKATDPDGNDTIQVRKWNDTKDYTGKYDDFVKDTNNDFKKIWSYKVNADTIKTITKTEDGDVYLFNVELNITDGITDEAISEYYKVMEVQLSTNAGMKVEGLKFTKVNFEVKVWKESGLIKQMKVTESYDMKVAGIIDSNVTLNMINKYSYDKNEATTYIEPEDSTKTHEYKMSDYLNLF